MFGVEEVVISICDGGDGNVFFVLIVFCVIIFVFMLFDSYVFECSVLVVVMRFWKLVSVVMFMVCLVYIKVVELIEMVVVVV